MVVMNIQSTKPILVFLLASIFFFSSCFASDVPELITDRPDQTESSSTVPPGYVQIEVGWQHLKEEREDLETDIFP